MRSGTFYYGDDGVSLMQSDTLLFSSPHCLRLPVGARRSARPQACAQITSEVAKKKRFRIRLFLCLYLSLGSIPFVTRFSE
jgi:hypothetical protein